MHAPQVPVDVRIGYRPDIDGLRAVAVLSVLAYHYGAPIPGGFTGVDIFFVISGYLITARLSEDINAGRFSLLAFYDRRIRRILPALIVMLAVSLLAGRILLMPGDYKTLATSTAAAAFGVSNFFFLSNTGYFDQAANLMPQLHTWSLGVEEQFYLAWPPLLFLITAGRKRLDATAIVGALVIIGFGASLFWFDADPKSAFFMAIPRAWELTIGALLVFLPPLGRIASEAAMAVGSWLMVTGLMFSSSETFPGVAALYPCVGAALVIWPRRQPIAASIALGWLAPIGLISYSLYLWHWPVLVYFRIYINNGQPTVHEALLLAAGSIVLAAASYLYIEKPFRKPRAHPARNIWAGFTACTVVFCASMYVQSKDGLPSRVPEAVQAMRSLDVMWDWECRENMEAEGAPTIGRCVFGGNWATAKRKVLLWGDSHAMVLASIIEQAAESAGVSVLLSNQCMPIADGDILKYDYGGNKPTQNFCAADRRKMLAALDSRIDIDLVIVAASWAYMKNGIFNEGASTNHLSLTETGLESTISAITKSGRKVVLVTSVPNWGTVDPWPCGLNAVGLPRRPCDEIDHSITKAQFETQRDTVAIIERVAARHDAAVIYAGDRMCQSNPCITELNGEPLYRDGSHIRRNLSPKTNADLGRLIGFDDLFTQTLVNFNR